jgi:hypothetical protein
MPPMNNGMSKHEFRSVMTSGPIANSMGITDKTVDWIIRMTESDIAPGIIHNKFVNMGVDPDLSRYVLGEYTYSDSLDYQYVVVYFDENNMNPQLRKLVDIIEGRVGRVNTMTQSNELSPEAKKLICQAAYVIDNINWMHRYPDRVAGPTTDKIYRAIEFDDSKCRLTKDFDQSMIEDIKPLVIELMNYVKSH